MIVGIATDHNGVNEKQVLIDYIKENGIEVVDYSPINTDTDDYPDYAKKVATAVKNGQIRYGILMCGTGIGMSIAANKVKGIRAAKVSSVDEARLAKEHNNANIVCLSYKEDMDKLKEMILTFIKTEFSNEERHVRRVAKIGEIENDQV